MTAIEHAKLYQKRAPIYYFLHHHPRVKRPLLIGTVLFLFSFIIFLSIYWQMAILIAIALALTTPFVGVFGNILGTETVRLNLISDFGIRAGESRFKVLRFTDDSDHVSEQYWSPEEDTLCGRSFNVIIHPRSEAYLVYDRKGRLIFDSTTLH